MPLPILSSTQTATPADLVRLFHQSELDWCRHLGEETTLDAGTRISNPSLSEVPDANCFVNARLLPGITPSALVAEIQSPSAAGPCLRWTLNPSAEPEPSARLTDHLVQSGWAKSSQDILTLRKQRISIGDMTDFTVIPARASFPYYRRLMEKMVSNAQAVEAAMLHLDDSHFDAILAIQDRQPIAAIGVLTSGEVGTIRQWFVATPHRHRGIGRFMLSRILDVCGRAGFRHVMASVEPGTSAATILNSAGFEHLGALITFRKDEG